MSKCVIWEGYSCTLFSSSPLGCTLSFNTENNIIFFFLRVYLMEGRGIMDFDTLKLQWSILCCIIYKYSLISNFIRDIFSLSDLEISFGSQGSAFGFHEIPDLIASFLQKSYFSFLMSVRKIYFIKHFMYDSMFVQTVYLCPIKLY